MIRLNLKKCFENLLDSKTRNKKLKINQKLNWRLKIQLLIKLQQLKIRLFVQLKIQLTIKLQQLKIRLKI